MPLTLANVNQAAVEQEVSQQYRAARGANPRVVHIQGWQQPGPNEDFLRTLSGGGRRAPRTDEVIEVKTERVPGGPAGRVAVYLVPNTQNNSIRNLHGTMKVKVGEADI
jgi:hypothetical protein